MGMRKYRQGRMRLLAMWRDLLTLANNLSPETDDPEELEALAEVKDYIIDQVEAHEAWLKIGVLPEKVVAENAQFATCENRLDNGSTAGAR
jgi:hypothetical protein